MMLTGSQSDEAYQVLNMYEPPKGNVAADMKDLRMLMAVLYTSEP